MSYPRPFDATNEALIRSFKRTNAKPDKDFVIDFLGTRTRTTHIPSLQGGLVEDYPIPGNFHASALEWSGCLRSVAQASKSFVMIEAGAGWAPWMVSLSAAAKQRRIKEIRLLGIDPNLTSAKTHLADNDIHESALLEAVVGPSDGVAKFPKLKPGDYGQAAIFEQPEQPGDFDEVRSISLETLLAPFKGVDLLHIDVQGAEYAILQRVPSLAKVKRMVIGTHSRAIEQKLLHLLAANWTLECEEACWFTQVDASVALTMDGCQVWVNKTVAF